MSNSNELELIQLIENAETNKRGSVILLETDLERLGYTAEDAYDVVQRETGRGVYVKAAI